MLESYNIIWENSNDLDTGLICITEQFIYIICLF